MDHKTIRQYQKQVLEELQKVGAKVSYTKALSQYSNIMTKIKKREPIINVEASLMGEKFGIVIGYPIDYEKVIRTDKVKIFHITDYDQFLKAWKAFITHKINS